MRKKRIAECIALLLAVLTLLTGCTVQSTPLDERAVVRLMYLEKEGTVYRALTVVCDFAGSGENEPAAAFVQTGQGKTPEEALQAAAQQRGDKPFFAQNQLLLLGPQLARTETAALLGYIAQTHGAYRDPAAWLWYGGEQALVELKDPMAFVEQAEMLTKEDPLGCVCYALEWEQGVPAVLPVLEVLQTEGADSPAAAVGGLAVADETGLRLYREKAILLGYGLLRGRQKEQLLTVENGGSLYSVQLEGLKRSFAVQDGVLRLTVGGNGSAAEKIGEELHRKLETAAEEQLVRRCELTWRTLTQNGKTDIFSLRWWARQLGAERATVPEFTARIQLS